MKKHGPTGNKYTDRAIVDLQKQIDTLQKKAHPKTNKFNGLILDGLKSSFQNVNNLLKVDKFGIVSKGTGKCFFKGDVNTTGMVNTNWWCATHDLGSGDPVAGDFASSLTTTGQELNNTIITAPRNLVIKGLNLLHYVKANNDFRFMLIDFKPNAAGTTVSSVKIIFESSYKELILNRQYTINTRLNYTLQKYHGLIYAWSYRSGTTSTDIKGHLTLEIET